MNIKTHRLADVRLLGKPIFIQDDVKAEVELETTQEMAIDELGLIHGGFSFSLADYAAMLSVNHPYVVLGASEVRFLAPVKNGDVMRAYAMVEKIEGNRRDVSVDVFVGEKKVLESVMKCFILDNHVLSIK